MRSANIIINMICHSFGSLQNVTYSGDEDHHSSSFLMKWDVWNWNNERGI